MTWLKTNGIERLTLKNDTENVIAHEQTTSSQQSCEYCYTYQFVTPLANKNISNLFPHFTHAYTLNPYSYHRDITAEQKPWIVLFPVRFVFELQI